MRHQHKSHYLESRHNGCEADGREATPRHNQKSFCASELTKGTVQSACNMRGPCVPHGLSEHLEALSLCRTELIAIQCTRVLARSLAHICLCIHRFSLACTRVCWAQGDGEFALISEVFENQRFSWKMLADVVEDVHPSRAFPWKT